jgi:hypothetical protein
MKVYTYRDEKLVGLSQIKKNHWRISQTGERFTCHDEDKAVEYFKQQLGGKKSVLLPIAKGTPV